jgi:hypothetical protein
VVTSASLRDQIFVIPAWAVARPGERSPQKQAKISSSSVDTSTYVLPLFRKAYGHILVSPQESPPNTSKCGPILSRRNEILCANRIFMNRVFPSSAEETVRFDRYIPTTVYLIAHYISNLDVVIWQTLLELSLFLGKTDEFLVNVEEFD